MPEQNSSIRVLITSDDQDLKTKLNTALAGNDIAVSITATGSSPENCGFNQAARQADVLIVPIAKSQAFEGELRQKVFVGIVSGIRNIVLLADSGSASDDPVPATFSDSLSQFCEMLEGRGTGKINARIIDRFEGANSLSAFLGSGELITLGNSNNLRISVSQVADNGEISGTILAGDVAQGEEVVILPSAVRTSVTEVLEKDQNIQLKLDDHSEINSGDMICNTKAPVEAADQFETTIIWCGEDPMIAGRPYELRSTTNFVDASITSFKYLINVDQDEPVAATKLERGELGVCNISLSKRIPFEGFAAGRESSQFVLIDKESGEEVGFGAIHFALRRASNVHWQALDVTRSTRAQQKGQKAAILWFTGLSGSGKSAIANIIDKKLVSQGRHTYTLDGDNIRHGLNRDLGFTDVDRVENIRRIGEVAKLMADSGLICLVSFISPFRSERQLARELAEDGEFIEIYVDTPLEVAEERDVKGLYKKARAGEIKNFTGIDSPYEAPENPEIQVDTTKNSAEESAEMILDKLQQWGVIVLD